MSHSREEFSIHLAQALSYLHSRHHHIKTWAALFIGERGGGRAQEPPGLPCLSTLTLTLARSSTAAGTWVPLARRGASEGVSGCSVLWARPFCALALSFQQSLAQENSFPMPGRGRERGKGGEVQEPPPTGRHAPHLSRRLYHLLPPPGCVPDGQ